MEALKSTALVPGEPEYRTEYNLLNMLLVKIPKHVDLRPILNVKPLQPRHCVALQELHSELFPIRYDPRFFEVACSTECGFLDSQALWEFFDFSYDNNTGVDWHDNRIMSLGVFLPRSYVSYFRRTGKYELDRYLEFLVTEGDYTEFDDPLTEMLMFDPECDEFLIGFITLLINADYTNNLVSDDDYKILNLFYKRSLVPLLGGEDEASADPNEDANDLTHEPGINCRFEVPLNNDVEKIRNCYKLNLSHMDDTLYSFIYNHLYTNDLVLDYVAKFNIGEAKTIYILSTGITLGLRRRSLGTNLILLVQVLVYYINHSIYLYQGQYYKLGCPPTGSKTKSVYTANHIANRDKDISPERAKNIMNIIRHYYNTKLFNGKLLYMYYHFVLNIPYTPYHNFSILDSCMVKYEGEETHKHLNNDVGKNNVNEAEPDSTDDFVAMPMAIYLHAIYYNVVATRMYENLNFYKIATIPDYYNIDEKRYDAHFLAHYICP